MVQEGGMMRPELLGRLDGALQDAVELQEAAARRDRESQLQTQTKPVPRGRSAVPGPFSAARCVF